MPACRRLLADAAAAAAGHDHGAGVEDAAAAARDEDGLAQLEHLHRLARLRQQQQRTPSLHESERVAEAVSGRRGSRALQERRSKGGFESPFFSEQQKPHPRSSSACVPRGLLEWLAKAARRHSHSERAERRSAASKAEDWGLTVHRGRGSGRGRLLDVSDGAEHRNSVGQRTQAVCCQRRPDGPPQSPILWVVRRI